MYIYICMDIYMYIIKCRYNISFIHMNLKKKYFSSSHICCLLFCFFPYIHIYVYMIVPSQKLQQL